jgi:pilus assembly protein CpaE
MGALASRVLLLSIDGRVASQVVPALEGRGMEVAVTGDPQVALRRLAEHQLVILDAPEEATVAMLCRRINDEVGSAHPPILAVAHGPNVESRVGMLEAGADDVVAQPIDPRELEALVEALLLRAPGAATAGAETAAILPPTPAGPGRVIAFASAKGGSGTTSLAVNTALVLAEMAPGNVAIVDLDMYHGQVATHLDLYGRRSTADLAREDHSSPNPEVFAEAGRRHGGGLLVFGGPYRPDDATGIGPAHLVGLVEQMRGLYGTLVIDVGSTLDDRSFAVLAKADEVALVLTPDIPSLRLLHTFLQVMSESGGATDRSLFVVNNIYPKAMINAEQVEEHLGIKIGLEIPYDSDSFVKAVNEGQPLMTFARRSPAAASIRKLAAELTTGSAPDAERAAKPQPRKGLFRNFLARD